MDKLRAISYFIKVAETSSFTIAAKAFSVPASSVSRRIKDLENHLKIELFHRSTRIVKLTSLGQLYYDQTKDILSQLDYAEELVDQRSKIPAGRLKITAVAGYGRAQVIPALNKFQELYPDIVIDLELTDNVSDLEQNQIDFAIRASSNLPERMIARKLTDNNFQLLAAPAYLEKFGSPTTADELKQHKTLLYRGPNGILQWQVLSDGKWRELDTNPAYISNDGTSILEATTNGKGISLLPKWSVKDLVTSGKLVNIQLPHEQISLARVTESNIYLLYQRPRYEVIKVRAAIDFLLNELRQEI